MIITKITVAKVDHANPRYPDADAMKGVPFSDVYLCQCTTDDGQEFECPYFVAPDAGGLNWHLGLDQDVASNMLKLFAAAIAKMAERQEAA